MRNGIADGSAITLPKNRLSPLVSNREVYASRPDGCHRFASLSGVHELWHAEVAAVGA
jgi:hypothetical protein